MPKNPARAIFKAGMKLILSFDCYKCHYCNKDARYACARNICQAVLCDLAENKDPISLKDFYQAISKYLPIPKEDYPNLFHLWIKI